MSALALVGTAFCDPAFDFKWLQNATSEILSMARFKGDNNTTLYAPGGHYQGVWMRDSYYGFSSGWDQIPAEDEIDAIGSSDYLLSRPSESGTFPQSVTRDTHGVWTADYGQWGAECNTTLVSRLLSSEF